MPSVTRRGLYHCASVVVFILLSTLIGACCTDATPAMRINTTATAAGCAGAQSSSWTDIEIALRRCGTSDDTWKAVASSFEFKVEPAQAHGAQVLLHTLMATRMVPNATDVSWVTQLTPDRLNLFKQMLQRWQGPASVTLYVHDLATALKLIHPLRARVDFHVVLADLHPGRLYPVNTLRNVAINKCRSHWMALVDADFIPNRDLYAQLQAHVLGLPPGAGDREVYVLPAFQLQRHRGNTTVPQTKQELLAMGDKVSQVHPEKGRDVAHSPTDYARWRTATEPYEVRFRMPYEPYYLANKRVPRYDAAFLGYGNDKTGQCYEVSRAGFKFKVLPFAFVFHMDHPRGDWLRSDEEWLVRGPHTLEAFLADVAKRYSASGERVAGTVVDAAQRQGLQGLAGELGENCSAVCQAHGLGCWGGMAAAVNTCAALRLAFGFLCDGGCSDAMYGHDLPAYNAEHRKCLLNQKPAEYALWCAATHPRARRLCPCAKPLDTWLTASWVQQFKAAHNLFGGQP